jgi:hypothetical protein
MGKRFMTRKFVIISMPRSGSRMLSSALNYTYEKEQSWCWNEILRPDVLAKKQMIGHPSNNIFAYADPEDETSVMDNFFAFNNVNVACAGFVAHFWNGFEETSRKYELTDNLNPWPYLIDEYYNGRVNFILLYRKNLFRRYISHVVANGGENAEVPSCWHMFNESMRMNVKVRINREKAIANIRQAKRKIDAISSLFDGLHVCYEDVNTQWKNIVKLTNPLCDGVPDSVAVTTKIIQDYSSVVENWDEVKDLDICS